MLPLNDEAKLSFAKEFTELAIQNKFIPDYNDEIKNAEAISKFYKTLVDKLDSYSK